MNFEPYIFAAIGFSLGPNLIYAIIYGFVVLQDWRRSRKYELKLIYAPTSGFIDLMKYA